MASEVNAHVFSTRIGGSNNTFKELTKIRSGDILVTKKVVGFPN